MPFLALIIAAVLIVAAIRNTQGELLSAIRQDVPAFAIWGAAIFGVAMIGFIPGLKPVSRGLLALLIVAIVLANYRNVLGAFQGVAYGAQEQALRGTPTGSLGASGAASGGAFAALLSSIGAGASADYSDALGIGATSSPPTSSPPAGSGAGTGATGSASIPYETPAKSGVAAMVAAVVETVGNGLEQFTAAGRQWQRDEFEDQSAALAAKVASGTVDRSSPEYRSQVDYLANLVGGVASYDVQMAKLKAMGL